MKKRTRDYIFEKDYSTLPIKLSSRGKGRKITRKEDLFYYGEIISALDKVEAWGLIPLISQKSYDLEKNGSQKKKQDIFYLTYFLKLTPSKVKKHLDDMHKLNHWIVECIEDLTYELDYLIKSLFKDSKRAAQYKTWFVDVFKISSGRYLPNWNNHKRKSKNHPAFKKSYEKFYECVVNNKTYKELGYTGQRVKNFLDTRLFLKVKSRHFTGCIEFYMS
ncbi:MAG: hypothetical protein HZA16_02795 [Nitrospirae bacterium]|nr:hypothetical protein [Nitrospirota bacterium]